MKNKPLPENPTLKNLREWQAISQNKLAKKINVHQTAISNYELGKDLPTLDKAAALAKELNVSMKTLMRSLNIDVTKIPDDIPNED